MKIVILVNMLFCLTACNSATTAAPTLSVDSKNLESKVIEIPLASSSFEFQGTVKYISLEGGFYAIYADDGRKFMPRKLGELHRKHGLVVYVRGKILKDMVTFQQHGQVLDISSIEIIDDSNVGRLEDM